MKFNNEKFDSGPQAWENFEKFADEASKLFIFRLEQILKSKITKDSIILDVGSGSGRFSASLREMGYKNAFSLDINPSLGEKTIIARIESLPVKSDSIDFVNASSVFDSDVYDHNQKKMMSEIARILKPNGIAYIAGFTPSGKDIPKNLKIIEKHPLMLIIQKTA